MVAMPRRAEARAERKRTAAQHVVFVRVLALLAGRILGRALRVIIGVVTIATPLPQIAEHVVKPERIRRLLTDVVRRAFAVFLVPARLGEIRSEEHTSELQS